MERGHSPGAYKPLLLAFLSLGLVSLARAQQRRQRVNVVRDEGQVQGTVRLDGGNKDNVKAVVRLEDPQGRIVGEEDVSANGQFSFTGLPELQYTLFVAADGYETNIQRLDLTSGGAMPALDIVLRPTRNEEANSISSAARTDATAPAKARKELEKGVRASEQRKLREAQAHFGKAIRIYPCYARAQVGLALTLMRGGDSAQAEAPLKKAIECDPDFVEPYLHLGRLFNAEQRYIEGRSVLAEGVRRSPGSWVLYYHLGQADEGLKNYALAEEELLRALSFGPRVSASVHEKLAEVYLRDNAYDKGYAEMRAYLQAYPQGPYAARIKAVMRELESEGRVHLSQSQLVSAPPKP
jgi:tetratricopeptide (TPR) repeat protein